MEVYIKESSLSYHMKNLAGELQADVHIHQELTEAGIEIVRGAKSGGEVPATPTGRLGEWEFSRAWYYWIAVAPNGKGLPLDVAIQMHTTEYPDRKRFQIYGEVIRVDGNCQAPHPSAWAFPPHEALNAQLSKWGSINATYGEIADLCNTEMIEGQRFVHLYHIDEQLGLNEFAKTVKLLISA